jgi:uncharacterized protein (DUF1800 family)
MALRGDTHLALNRFGLGARPDEAAAIGADGEGWLRAQLNRPEVFRLPADGLPTAQEAGEAYRALIENRRAAAAAGQSAAPPDPAPQIERTRALLQREGEARAQQQLRSPHGFAERLTRFWSNHFTVAATKAVVAPYVGLFEREAVRPHLTGSFEALLLATAVSQGMLAYLDQWQSIGPNSAVGRRRGAGLNENYAREVLELHTLGVDGGYTQADVIELARALTGWTIAAPQVRRLAPQAAPYSFVFVPALHEPGARTLLGKRYREGGVEQGRAMLRDLARHPATARHVARRLARHFGGDDPPQSLVVRLEREFLASEGDLPRLHAAVLDGPEVWAQEPLKFKQPEELLVSGLRLLGADALDARGYAAGLELMGQPLFRTPSPEGWPDDAASWAAPDALMKRLEWAQALSRRAAPQLPARPEQLGAAVLGPQFTAATRQAVARAESAAQGLTLLLMSPEFQRR